MKRFALIPMLLAVAATSPATVTTSAEALAMGDSLTANGRQGRYEMTVASTGKSAKATFLNSTEDYKGPGNLTFSIAPIVANALAKRYGAPPEDYFKGKTVTTDGILRREAVMAMVGDRAHHVVRQQLTVRIEQARQIVAVR